MRHRIDTLNFTNMDYPLQVLFEDNHLIVVNKPAGWLVQGDETGDRPLSEYVKDYIAQRYNKPGAVFLGVVHRLDRPVSGVCIFARTSKALERMNKLFHDQEIKKTYWAITDQVPDPLEGHLVHYLLKDRERNVTKAYDRPSNRNEGAKRCELTYKLLGQLNQSNLIEVFPQTGRSHQIRAQLARIGCPIRGDVKYGYPKLNENACIHLHCRRMEFIHPVKKEPVNIEAEPPKDPAWDQFRHLD